MEPVADPLHDEVPHRASYEFVGKEGGQGLVATPVRYGHHLAVQEAEHSDLRRVISGFALSTIMWLSQIGNLFGNLLGEFPSVVVEELVEFGHPRLGGDESLRLWRD